MNGQRRRAGAKNGPDSPQAKSVPSLIKWTGSKRSQAHAISALFPPHDRYFEPFLGSGALLYTVDSTKAVCGDVYKPLIELWKGVQSGPAAIIDAYADDWNRLQADLPAYFYTVRDRFNQTGSALDLSFLSRTCVNGIIRFNEKGAFNNSFHLSRRGMHPDRFAKIVMDWHRHIQGTRFLCADYVDTLSEARKGDLVYLDPPYAGNQCRYAENLDLGRFFAVLEKLNTADIRWIVSFDGIRGRVDLTYPFPKHLYKRHVFLHSGNSAVKKVLSGRVEPVRESVYLNY